MSNNHAYDMGVGRAARELWAGQRYTPDAEHQNVTFQIGVVMDDYDEQRAGRVWVYFPNFSSLTRGEIANPYGPIAHGRTIGADGTVTVDQTTRTSWILCYPMFPMFGSDDFRHGGDTSSSRSGRRGQSNSYGMWYQPRIGDYVGVLFAYGDASQAFWIGCVPKPNQNFMVPGHAAEAADGDEEGSTVYVPSHEKSLAEADQPRQVSTQFASNLTEAGLLGDGFRGAGASSATRESPSYVWGWKSPGWTYEIEKELPIGGGNKSPFKSSGKYSKVNSMGHQFVFDDHPDHQMVRLRTSNGSQILFNDVDGYIYINTAKGNTWLEMSDTGDVNGFSTGAFSWHAQGDINMTTDANWNVQVKGNWNVAVGENTTMLLNKAVTIFSGQGGQAFQWQHNGPAKAIITGLTQLQVKNSMEVLVENNVKVTAKQNMELISGQTFGVKADSEVNLTSGAETNILAGSTFYTRSGAETSLQSGGTFYADGAVVLWGVGGPVAKDAGISSPAAPAPPGQPELAKTWGPTPKSGTAEKIPYVGSIVPQHEPWPGHPVSSGGMRNNVQFNTAFVQSLRRGATSANASKPVDYVDSQGKIHSGQNYATNNPGESPKYTITGDIDPKLLGPAGSMGLSEEGKAFIKKQEGWSSVPYPDAGGYSIGYGHYINVGDNIGGRIVTESDMAMIRAGKGAQVLNITQEEGNALFDKDLPKYQGAVQKYITAPITQGQFDAMTSLSYNVGPDWIRKSTMTKKFNNGDIPGAITEFQGFNKSEGQVNAGLVKRRNEEIDKLFSKGIPVAPTS